MGTIAAMTEGRAAAVDARAAASMERNRAAAEELRGRCAPPGVAFELGHAAAAAPAPLPLFAARVLGLVAASVRAGYAGACISADEIGIALGGYSGRWVWAHVAELRRLGYLRRTRDSVPASETRLGAPYVTRSAAARRRGGRATGPRSLRSDSPTYTRSTVRNLYTLGPAARALKLGVRCGQVRGQLSREVDFIATGLPLSPVVSASDSGREVRTRRACEIVDKRADGPCSEQSSGVAAEPRREIVFRAEAVREPEHGPRQAWRRFVAWWRS